MKKIMLMLMSAFLIAGTSYAQQQSDTTRTGQRTKQQAESGQPADMAREPRSQQPTHQPERASNFAGDMEVVQPEELPQSLKNTLQQDEKYKGWENAVIYHNKRTDEYLVSPRPYRFDSEGNPVDATRSGQRQNQQRDIQEDSQPEEDQSSAYRQSPTDPNRKLDTASNNEMANEQQQQQTDTTQRNENAPQGQQQSNAYRSSDRDIDEISMTGMTMIEQNEYPEALRETLQDPKYNGWENGQVYHNESTGEYLLIINDEANRNSGKKRHFRFDKNGEDITDDSDNK